MGSGFELRTRVPVGSGDNVVGEFTGVTELFEKGDVVMIGNDRLLPGAPNSSIGATEKQIEKGMVFFNTITEQHHLIPIGKFSDGTLLCYTDGTYYPDRKSIASDSTLFAVKDGEILWKKKADTINGWYSYANICVDSVQDRIYVCHYLPSINACDTFRFRVFDKNFNLIKACADEVCTAPYSGPQNPQNANMIASGNGVVVIIIRTGSSSNILGCIVYDTGSETKHRDPVAAPLSGLSYYSSANATELYRPEPVWLNDEHTRFVMSHLTYNSNPYTYGFLLCDTSPEEVADCIKAQMSKSHSSPAISYAQSFGLSQPSYEDQMHQHGIRMGGGVEGVILPVCSSNTFNWTGYITSGNTFQQVSGASFSASNAVFFFTFESGDYFFTFYQDTNSQVIRVTCGNRTTGGQIWTETLRSSYTTALYSGGGGIVYKNDQEGNATVYMSMTQGSGSYQSNTFYMLKLEVTPSGASMGMLTFSPTAGTTYGKILATMAVGKYIATFAGCYSDGTNKADFRYHLFDTETGSWVDETTADQHLIRTMALNQNYWNVYPYSYNFLRFQKVGYNAVMILGYGLIHVEDTTDGRKHIDRQLLVLDIHTLLGVAESAVKDGKLRVGLQGNFPLNSKYAKIFKFIDHSALGGNTGAIYGSVSMLKGV